MDSHAFGLCNASITFMRLMNRVLQKSIGHFVVYFDDILVYSRSFDKHIEHLTKGLKCLEKKSYLPTLRNAPFEKNI